VTASDGEFMIVRGQERADRIVQRLKTLTIGLQVVDHVPTRTIRGFAWRAVLCVAGVHDLAGGEFVIVQGGGRGLFERMLVGVAWWAERERGVRLFDSLYTSVCAGENSAAVCEPT
jgi:hypothetical protein